jgi:pyruvate/2-oxoglutarate/acetoin dehydrogenase E1 component
VPGLQVVAPSTPGDAYAALRAAIRANDPVLNLEHRSLYWTRGPAEAAGDPWTARVARPGRDVTVIAWSRMVHTVLSAATALATEGIEVEVVDARVLSPLDLDPMLESVRRTRRAAVVAESVVTGGLGAEIAADLSAGAFDRLEAPIARIGAPFTPPPAGPELEAQFVPGADRIAAEVRTLVGRAASRAKGRGR